MIEGFEIRAWLLEIKKCLISANALCRPPGTLSLVEDETAGLDDKLDLEAIIQNSKNRLNRTMRLDKINVLL